MVSKGLKFGIANSRIILMGGHLFLKILTCIFCKKFPKVLLIFIQKYYIENASKLLPRRQFTGKISKECFFVRTHWLSKNLKTFLWAFGIWGPKEPKGPFNGSKWPKMGFRKPEWYKEVKVASNSQVAPKRANMA